MGLLQLPSPRLRRRRCTEPAHSLAPKAPVVLSVGGPTAREEGGHGERAGRQHIQQENNSPVAKVEC